MTAYMSENFKRETLNKFQKRDSNKFLVQQSKRKKLIEKDHLFN